jgi:2-hydroxychromene-2-carboxylate isomerase
MTTRTIDYYFAPISPFAYLGHQRLADIAQRHGADIRIKPINLGTVLPVSGGLPLSKRAPQRQAYRLTELRRWSAFLDLPMNVHPRHFPVNGDAAARLIIVTTNSAGTDAAMRLTARIMRGVWIDEQDVSNRDTLFTVAKTEGLDANALLAQSEAPEAQAAYEQFTEEAIDCGVFGSPTYIYRDELFWGQDRLDFLERALTARVH